MAKGFTDTVLMIRPKNFKYNVQTAKTNVFQTAVDAEDDELSEIILKEFDNVVDTLKANGIKVDVFEDTTEPVRPDAIFPNNWITFHEDGSIVTYSMFAPNRRQEVRKDIIEDMKKRFGFNTVVDFGHYTDGRIFLEGSGSMVLDRENKKVYACLSPRTDERLLNQFCELKEYDPFVFDAVDKTGMDIYHTNVMMALGPDYAVLCLECIEDQDERRGLIKALAATGKEIFPITASQMGAFAGNVLHLKNSEGEDIILMSERAKKILIDSQMEKLEGKGKVVTVDVNTIEAVGGGGIRCMLAEVFSPK